MPLVAGAKLGPYEIRNLIGAGGMGEVYRARDPRLGRDVAIKVLLEVFAKDAERMARFEREAQLLAALNHPNIATLLGLEESDKSGALVMELVEGPTLADRLAAGPIPLDEALPIARQIAEALEYAHEKSIVHRDLKPANVKLTREGVVKVLDFGLAKALGDDPGEAGSANSPTLSLAATRAGMILGTAAYMAPEQAKGKPVDRRADIWAFGVVLFEMLTGRRLYSGETAAETLAAVMMKEPALDPLPAETPQAIRKLLRRCVEKDRKRRLQSIGEARIAIEEELATPARDAAVVAASPPPRPKRALAWMALVAAVATVAALALAVAYFRRTPAEARAVSLALPPPEKASFGPIAVSPDGRRVAFTATQAGRTQLWVRPLDSTAAQALPGTEDASYPFWSPDSRFLGFFAQGKVKKIEASGGPPRTLADAPAGRGGTWSRDGVIIFAPAPGAGLSRLAASGVEAKPLTTLDPSRLENSHRWPVFLPDGRHYLCYVRSPLREHRGIYVFGLDSKKGIRLLGDESNVAYVEMPSGPGYLLFIREAALLAQPFDAKQLQLAGEPFSVAERVGYEASFSWGAFSASNNGVLVYDPIGPSLSDQLTWFDREGKRLGAVGSPVGVHYQPWLSPDEKSVAIEQFDLQLTFDIWLIDLSRGAPSRFTFDPANDQYPVWSPDGSRIAFASSRNGLLNLYLKVATGAGQEELLQKSAIAQAPEDWSRDGRWLAYWERHPETSVDLWVLPLSGDRKPVPFLRTKANEHGGRFSPDGKWMAYHSDETGSQEVYVQPFPASGGRWQVSKDGGGYPKWRRDGKELFYLAADKKIVAVDVETGSTFQVGVPRPLFETRISVPYAHFAVTGDGRRFLVPTPVAGAQSTPATVVLNWTAGIKR